MGEMSKLGWLIGLNNLLILPSLQYDQSIPNVYIGVIVHCYTSGQCSGLSSGSHNKCILSLLFLQD
jgi:hypothetical protein